MHNKNRKKSSNVKLTFKLKLWYVFNMHGTLNFSLGNILQEFNSENEMLELFFIAYNFTY